MFGRRRRRGQRGWRLDSGGAQGSVDHHPDLLLRQGSADAFTIDEEYGRSFHSQRFGLLHRGARLGLILFGEAGVEPVGVETISPSQTYSVTR